MNKKLKKIIISAILFVIALVVPFENLIHTSYNAEYINNTIFIIAYLVVGLEILKKALKKL